MPVEETSMTTTWEEISPLIQRLLLSLKHYDRLPRWLSGKKPACQAGDEV